MTCMNRPNLSRDDREASRFVAEIINSGGWVEVPRRQIGDLEPLPVVVRAADAANLLGFDEVQQLGWAALWLAFRNVIAAIDPTLLVVPRSKYGSLRPTARTAEGARINSDRVQVAIEEVFAMTLATCEECGRPGELRTESRYWWRTLCNSHEEVVPR